MYAYANQLVVLRHEQGRLDELIPNMEATVRSNPAASVYQAALAWALAVVRSPDAARPIVEQLTAGGQRVLPPDTFLPVTLTLLAEAAVLIGEPAIVASILRQLAPFEGQLSVAGRGVVCMGAIDRRLGILSAHLGRRGQAEAHLRSALTLEQRLQSRPLVARTTWSWDGSWLRAMGVPPKQHWSRVRPWRRSSAWRPSSGRPATCW